jgi:hypothetical protein
LEKAVALQLIHFLKINNVLHSQQYGFQQNKSTRDAMISLTEKVLKALDEGCDTYGIFCDLSKAFDCVDHSILCTKLMHYGIHGCEQEFFKSYLSNRSQITEINNMRSDMTEIKNGVPQGSILGPLLFILYVNDLPEIIRERGEIVMYADDTSLLIKRKNHDEHIAGNVAKVLDDVSQWFDSNKLILNMTKTNAMCFSLRPRNDAITDDVLTDKSINIVNDCKFLGIMMDSKLQWSTHIQQLCGRLSSAVFAIKKIKDICGSKTAKMVYFSYFHSVMVYGLVVWGGGADFCRVFTLQKRAVRAILGLQPRDSCRYAFKDLGIPTLASAYIHECILFARRGLGSTPLNSDHHNYDTRRKEEIRPIQHRLAKLSRSFLCRGVRFYNKLPQNIKSRDDEGFQREMKSYLVDKCYYSVDEMLG